MRYVVTDANLEPAFRFANISEAIGAAVTYCRVSLFPACHVQVEYKDKFYDLYHVEKVYGGGVLVTLIGG